METVSKPRLLAGYSLSGFDTTAGPGTQVASFDSSLSAPGSSHLFNMVFVFNKEMDSGSVQNFANWSIGRAAYGAAGGAYNWGLPSPSSDVALAASPVSVFYDARSLSATVSFLVTQNAAGDGTFDPSHITFRFSGTDAYGNAMDTSADQYGGLSKIV